MTEAEDLLAELATWVRLETPSTDAGAVNRLMDVAERDLAAVGAMLTRVPGKAGYGDSLIARTPGPEKRREVKPILVAGHLDTVWAHGTLAKMPFRVNGEKAHGPGIFDMKAGSFLAAVPPAAR
jgi:glutamate carboxypeptidase